MGTKKYSGFRPHLHVICQTIGNLASPAYIEVMPGVEGDDIEFGFKKLDASFEIYRLMDRIPSYGDPKFDSDHVAIVHSHLEAVHCAIELDLVLESVDTGMIMNAIAPTVITFRSVQAGHVSFDKMNDYLLLLAQCLGLNSTVNRLRRYNGNQQWSEFAVEIFSIPANDYEAGILKAVDAWNLGFTDPVEFIALGNSIERWI